MATPRKYCDNISRIVVDFIPEKKDVDIYEKERE